MRVRTFYIGVVCLFGVLRTSAQPYIPMLGNTNEWRVVSCYGGCVTDAYGAVEDTVVDGLTYKVLGGYHYIEGNFLIREDSLERKVYMKLLGGHSLLNEYPLYDFSLSYGDTVNVYNPISPLPEDGGKYVLDSVVSRPLETGDHRFFYLHAVDPQISLVNRTVWVEGVGSLRLINTPGAPPTEEAHLVCAMKDDDLIYADLDSVFSCGPLSVYESHETVQLTAYPNPSNGIFSLKIDAGLKPVELEVLSTQGETIFLATWTEYIDLGDVASGVYLVKVTLIDGDIRVSRLVIDHQNSTR